MPDELRVSIHQPNYWPWLGYFHKMARCDVFVLLDDVQLARGKSFTSRVQIKTRSGAAWLTVPVQDRSGFPKIGEVSVVAQNPWRKKHWRKIEASYSRAPFFREMAPKIEAMYATDRQSLYDVNRLSIGIAKEMLGIRTSLVSSSELNVGGAGTEKLVELVDRLRGKIYISGEGAGSARYLDHGAFHARGIQVQPQGFKHPEYQQLWGRFLPNLSIQDLLFNHGPRSLSILMGQTGEELGSGI